MLKNSNDIVLFWSDKSNPAFFSFLGELAQAFCLSIPLNISEKQTLTYIYQSQKHLGDLWSNTENNDPLTLKSLLCQLFKCQLKTPLGIIAAKGPN